MGILGNQAMTIRAEVMSELQARIDQTEKRGGIVGRQHGDVLPHTISRLQLGNGFTDADLAQWKDCARLREISLAGSQVTDHGLVTLCMPWINHLDLSCTETSDEGLDILSRASVFNRFGALSFAGRE